MKLRIDVVFSRALEEGEGLGPLVVLEQFHGPVEGEQLGCRSDGLVGTRDVPQGGQCPLVVSAGHVHLQQEAVGFIASGRGGELLEVRFKGHNGVVKRVERQFVGQLGVVEERVFLNVEVKVRRGCGFEGLLRPCPIAHLEVAIGHVVGRVLGQFVFAVRGKGEAVQSTSPVAHAVTGVPHLVGKLRLASRTVGPFPRQFEVRRCGVERLVTVPSISEKVGDFSHAFFVEPTRLIQQGRGIVFQLGELTGGVKQLGDVQGNQFLEIGVIRNFFKSVERHLGLALQVGDVREVVLRGCLKFAFHFQDFVQRDACLFELLTFEIAMAQLEAVFVATGLGQVPHADSLEFLGCGAVILSLVVVVRQFPLRFQRQGALGELSNERFHPMNRIPVVQGERAHGGVVGRFCVRITRGA